VTERQNLLVIGVVEDMPTQARAYIRAIRVSRGCCGSLMKVLARLDHRAASYQNIPRSSRQLYHGVWPSW
jgi:hypothetical protein